MCWGWLWQDKGSATMARTDGNPRCPETGHTDSRRASSRRTRTSAVLCRGAFVPHNGRTWTPALLCGPAWPPTHDARAMLRKKFVTLPRACAMLCAAWGLWCTHRTSPPSALCCSVIHQVKRTVHSLAFGKFAILKREGENKKKQIVEDDEFQVCAPYLRLCDGGMMRAACFSEQCWGCRGKIACVGHTHRWAAAAGGKRESKIEGGGGQRQERQPGQGSRMEGMGERAHGRQRQQRGWPGQPAPSLPCARATTPAQPASGGGCLPQPRWAVCATGGGAHSGQTSREGERDIWWTVGTTRGGAGHLGLMHA